MWHADYKEGDEEGGAEEGGCEAGSWVEMGCHGRDDWGPFEELGGSRCRHC